MTASPDLSRTAYIDCFAGASGDMLLGALVDAGLSFNDLVSELAKLGLTDYELSCHTVAKHGISATKVDVAAQESHLHRHLSDIAGILEASSLDQDIKDRALAVFTRLAEAEAHVHGTTIEQVHFHEVGALDSIADIVGACIGFGLLGIEKIYCSPLNLGSGTVKAAHGVMPVPAPATAAVVEGLPTYAEGPAVGLTTPTGAAIVATLASEFGVMPAMRTSAIGYGAGDRDFKGRANLLRIVVGEQEDADVRHGIDLGDKKNLWQLSLFYFFPLP